LSTNRLYFIDAVRAFAILMMLQGHFIDSLLEISYRDTSNIAYRVWEYFRGITAPTFFTISGLIFSYLLIKAKHKGNSTKRMRKGLLRGLMLIGIGYSLRIPFFSWLSGSFPKSFLVIDVLQCIGLSLILVVLIYKLTFKKTLLFSILMFLIGIVIFMTEPLYRFLELPRLPIAISNYFSKANGSVFSMIPWFGYIAFGAFMSTLFYKFLERPKFKIAIISSFFIIGILLVNLSSWFLLQLHAITEFQLFYDVATYNYLFIRLGNVLVLFSIFYAAEEYIKQTLILKIGQKTLSIYVIHFIIIYGSYTGFGLAQIIGKTLVPFQAIFGALLFLTTVVFISFYYAKTNKFIYSAIRKIIIGVKKHTSKDK
jgi:uncharacterized membrane protein